MNKKFQFITILSIVLLNGALVFGQEQSIKKDEFEAVTIKAHRSLEGKTYRSTGIYETLTDRNSAPTVKLKTIFETLPPDRSYWLSEAGSEKNESITIGAKRYIRANGKEWKLDDGSGEG